MNRADSLQPTQILLDVPCRSKEELFELIADRLAAKPGLCPGSVLEALLRREALGETAIRGGIALPHAAVAETDGCHAVFLRLAAPIMFGAADHAPVDIAVGLLFPPEENRAALRQLSCYARRFAAPGQARALRRETCADRIHATLTGTGA